jgi:isopenicillin-N N-acyltransferase like protein
MLVLQLEGTARQVGQQYGEACRDAFRREADRARVNAARNPRWLADIHAMEGAYQTYTPQFYAEVVGAAQGAGLGMDDALLIHRNYLAAATLDPAPVDSASCCSNLAFLSTPTGPIFGKNLDLSPNPDRDHALRDISYDDGTRLVHTVVQGEITTRDTCMNGHGLIIGGSSVGSVYQQHIHNPTIEAGIYAMLRSCATTQEAIRYLKRYPWVGKGYNFVMVDASGDGVALECALPMIQVRQPQPGQDAIYCTNVYQMPALANSDLRTPQGKLYCAKRGAYLDRVLFQEPVPRTKESMQEIVSSQGPNGGLCRPIDEGDPSKTRISVIALPARRQLWLTDGQPCAVPFERAW